METLAICLLFYTALFFLDILPSIHGRQWKALRLAVPLLLLSMAVQILKGMNVPVPNPNAYIRQAIEGILHAGGS